MPGRYGGSALPDVVDEAAPPVDPDVRLALTNSTAGIGRDSRGGKTCGSGG